MCVYRDTGSVEFRVNFAEVLSGFMSDTDGPNFETCTFNDLNGF